MTFSTTSALSSLGRRRRSRAGALLAAHASGASQPDHCAGSTAAWRTLTRVEASGWTSCWLWMCRDRCWRRIIPLARSAPIGSKRSKRSPRNSFDSDRTIASELLPLPAVLSGQSLTLDHDWLIQNLDRLQIGLVEDGTAIGSAIAAAANRLKDKEAKSKLSSFSLMGQQRGSRHPVDGHRGGQGSGIRIYTIGAGTNGEVPFPSLIPLAEPSIEMSSCNITTSCSGRLLQLPKGNISVRRTRILEGRFQQRSTRWRRLR